MHQEIEKSKALACDARLTILDWLKEPDRHFSHQQTGRPSEIGVCVTLFAEKLGLAQPTVSRHLEILRRAGFVKAEKRGRWTFYSRDEAGLRAYRDWINEHL